MKYQRPSEEWLEYDVKIIGLPYGKINLIYFKYYIYVYIKFNYYLIYQVPSYINNIYG